jgi:hypothetical protein
MMVPTATSETVFLMKEVAGSDTTIVVTVTPGEVTGRPGEPARAARDGQDIREAVDVSNLGERRTEHLEMRLVVLSRKRCTVHARAAGCIDR